MNIEEVRLAPGETIGVRVGPGSTVRKARFDRYDEYGDVLCRVENETQVTRIPKSRVTIHGV